MRDLVLALNELGIFLWVLAGLGIVLIECIFKHPGFFKGYIRLRYVALIGIILIIIPIWVDTVAPGYVAEVAREKFDKELAELQAQNEEREQERDRLEKATIERYLNAEKYYMNNPATLDTKRAIGPFYFGMKETDYNKVLSEFREKANCEFIINDATIKLLPQYTKFENGQLAELYLDAKSGDANKILEYFNSNYGKSYYDSFYRTHYWHNEYKAINFGKDITISDIYFMEKTDYQIALDNQKRKQPTEPIKTVNAMQDSINRIDSINKRRMKEAYSTGL